MDCGKGQAKPPMVRAAQALSIRKELSLKGFRKHAIKEQLWLKTTEPEPTDFSQLPVKVDRHSAPALQHLSTQRGDLIDSKFVQLYCVPTRLNEKKILTIAIEVSQGTINK